MKPETARKPFTDPFRYWHPVTNNNVQKLKVLLVALLVGKFILGESLSWSFLLKLQQSNTSRIQPTEQALLFCFSPRFFFFNFNFNFFYFSIA